MLGVAAATAATAAGVAAATALSGPRSAGGTGIADAINHAGAVSSAVHPGHDSGGARTAPGQRPGQRPASRSPAHAQRQATARRGAVTPARPYLMYDSVTPSAIPAGHLIATYATGPYAVSPAQFAGRRVLWIDVTGYDPAADALDVEPTDATPAQAATWAAQRLKANPHALARIYTARGEWPAVQATIATLPHWMQSHVRWWIADPTGYPHILPGSDATQWYWGSGYDISTATPRF